MERGTTVAIDALAISNQIITAAKPPKIMVRNETTNNPHRVGMQQQNFVPPKMNSFKLKPIFADNLGSRKKRKDAGPQSRAGLK